MPRYQVVEGTSSKFWEIDLLRLHGQDHLWPHRQDRPDDAQGVRLGGRGPEGVRQADQRKLGKGYQPVDACSSSPEGAPPSIPDSASSLATAEVKATPTAEKFVETPPPPTTSERLPALPSIGAPINITGPSGRPTDIGQGKTRPRSRPEAAKSVPARLLG